MSLQVVKACAVPSQALPGLSFSGFGVLGAGVAATEGFGSGTGSAAAWDLGKLGLGGASLAYCVRSTWLMGPFSSGRFENLEDTSWERLCS